MKNNENKTTCSSCGGACCKNGAGGWFPEDLPQPITKDLIVDMIKNRGYCLDYWEGNPTRDSKYDGVMAYYLRPQHINALGRYVDPSWGAQCSFLTNNGCKLSFNDRPTQCKALIPNPEYSTKGCSWAEKYSKKNICIAWLPYNSILEEARMELYNLEEKL